MNEARNEQLAKELEQDYSELIEKAILFEKLLIEYKKQYIDNRQYNHLKQAGVI